MRKINKEQKNKMKLQEAIEQVLISFNTPLDSIQIAEKSMWFLCIGEKMAVKYQVVRFCLEPKIMISDLMSQRDLLL